MNMKSFNRIIAALLFTLATAFLLMSTGLRPMPSLLTAGGTAILLGLTSAPKASFFAGLYPELWTGELINKFRFDKSWLSLIPRRDDLVNSNAVHLVDIGVDPSVLINNTAYPIATSGRTDSDITLSLDKFDTVNTTITDDELYNLPYDKPGSVLQQHRLALEDATAIKSAWSLAPASGKTDGSTPNTPIVLTTGASDNRVNARKIFTPNDLIRAKEKLDELDVPSTGRIVLLDFYHLNDLLTLDEKFRQQWMNKDSGTLMTQMYGFTIAENYRPPVYTVAGGVYTKKAFGAASVPATDQRSSLFFYSQRAVQAVGSAKMYYSDAVINPTTRQSTVGFRIYQLCLQKKAMGFGAIVSDTTA